MEKLYYNDEYLESRETWQAIDDFVDGSTARVRKYVQRYASEKETDSAANAIFLARLMRIENENELDPIKAVLLHHLNQPLSFHDMAEDERMKIVIDDATGFDDSSQDVFSDLLSKYLDHGRVGLLVDSDAAIGATAEEAAQTGERSYQIVYPALDIVDWAIFSRGPMRGKFSRVVLKDRVIEHEKKERVTYLRFVLLPDGVVREVLMGPEPKKVIPADGVDVEVIESTKLSSILDIPFMLFGRGLKESVMRLPAQYSRKLLNDRSVRDNTDHHQNFQRTIITGARVDELTTLSENVIACIDNPEATVHTIEPGTADGIRRTIASLETKTRRQGMRQLNQIVSDDSREAPSAESKAMDLKALNAFFHTTITMFERRLRRVFQFHAAFEGYDGDVNLTIGRAFGLESVQDVRTERALVFSQAGTLGSLELQKQVLLQQLVEMKGIVPDANDIDGTKTKERLVEEIRNAKGPQPEPYAPFGKI